MKLFRELYHYREMLFSLVRKDLRGRYKGSVLGFLWTFINPLMQLLVYTFVFTVILPAQVEHYSLYLFVALILFRSDDRRSGVDCCTERPCQKNLFSPRDYSNFLCDKLLCQYVALFSDYLFGDAGNRCNL